jgi:hypothetical protein
MADNVIKTRIAPPSASSMIESLRGLGYSLAAALADIIDNSLAANASRVDLLFAWEEGRHVIAIRDNGHGMTDEELFKAMRLGFLSPLGERAKHDLGRFGLGLKTASFSQCRCLTVASRRQDADIAALCWDLDYLAASADNQWHMLEQPGMEAAKLFSMIENISQGTLVVWEKLDRIVTPGFSQQDYLDAVDVAERHLALTFHRFLQGPTPRLVLTINNIPIKAHDPFLQKHPATWNSPPSSFETEYGRISMQGHVLPHKDKLSSQEYEDAAGPKGWTEHQGFYVYRNERLIVAGSWLNLGARRAWTKEEAHRLARIRLDITNTADAAWKLDIRKSAAIPPVKIRRRLTQLAETVRKRARQVFAHRGEYGKTQTGQDPVLPIWLVENDGKGVRYRISRDHPAVLSMLADGNASEESVQMLLSLIERTVPVQRIWLDAAEGKDAPQNVGVSTPPNEMRDILKVVYSNLLKRTGISAKEAKIRLKNTEPFNIFPNLVDELSAD